jgi:[ribosomal protein S5]-alanine N-acetyltransferase
MLNLDPVFETARLVVRPWTLDDVPAAYEMYGDPEVQKGLAGQPIKDLAEQRERLQTYLDRTGQYDGIFGYWASALKETGEVIGAIMLKPLPDSEWVEVGWHLAQRHWGKGYATEGGRGALKYGFGTRRLDRVYAIALPWNVRSTSVMDRLGMKRLGTTTEFHNLELVLYAIDRSDFDAAEATP